MPAAEGIGNIEVFLIKKKTQHSTTTNQQLCYTLPLTNLFEIQLKRTVREVVEVIE